MRKIIGLFITVGLLIIACSQKSEKPVDINLVDYFPMEQGTTWHYEIEIGQVIPVISRNVIWPINTSQRYMVDTLGMYFRSIEGRIGKKYQLNLKVVGKVPEKTPVDYKDGVEVKVEKDELGVYSDYSILLWLIQNNSRFIIDETVLFPNTSPAAPPGWAEMTNGKENYGFYYQTIFFDGERGSKIGHGKQSPAELTFVGQEDDLLHFRRSFKKTVGSSVHVEDMWFEKGKGLVRLEQKLNGTVSMTWELIEFFPRK